MVREHSIHACINCECAHECSEVSDLRGHLVGAERIGVDDKSSALCVLGQRCHLRLAISKVGNHQSQVRANALSIGRDLLQTLGGRHFGIVIRADLVLADQLNEWQLALEFMPNSFEFARIKALQEYWVF